MGVTLFGNFPEKSRHVKRTNESGELEGTKRIGKDQMG